MVNYSSYINESDTNKGAENNDAPYFINCCGHTQFKSRNVSINRRRVDYYLIYLVNGCGYYKLDNEIRKIERGNIVLYRPLDEQDYYYTGSDKTELYWIHFTGFAVTQLLEELGLDGSHVYQVGINNICIELFEKIIHEINVKNPAYHSICISYLIQILSVFSRESLMREKGLKALKKSDIENVIKKMHQEYQNQHPASYYAESCNLSVYQFIRKFKDAMHVTPSRYIEKIRIDKSRELLADTDLTVNEIAFITGFSDPFYFSKVFKKNTGMNPTAFRTLKKA